MKKLFIGFLILLFLISQGYCANEWQKGTGEDVILGTESASDIDTISFNNVVDPLDRLLSKYRNGASLSYASVATITVGIGEITCQNTALTIKKMRANTSATTVAWTDIDTGSEASSTTYYVYGVADADATTFTCKISTNSSAPSGVTYYKRLGSFYNDSSSNITNIVNDTDWSAGAIYDSGWFAVATSSNYTKTHNLGTTKVLTLIYISSVSDGLTDCHLLNGESYLRQNFGTFMYLLNTTTISIRTADTYIYAGWNSSGDNVLTSGYARIVMLALE